MDGSIKMVRVSYPQLLWLLRGPLADEWMQLRMSSLSDVSVHTMLSLPLSLPVDRNSMFLSTQCGALSLFPFINTRCQIPHTHCNNFPLPLPFPLPCGTCAVSLFLCCFSSSFCPSPLRTHFMMMDNLCSHSRSSSPATLIIPWPIGVPQSPFVTGLPLPAAAVIQTEWSSSTSMA